MMENKAARFARRVGCALIKALRRQRNATARYARRAGCAQSWRGKVGGYAASKTRTQGGAPLLRLRSWPTAISAPAPHGASP